MIGPNPTRVCVDWVRFPICFAPDPTHKFRQCLPCCSPGTHPLCLLQRRVSGEQRGGAAEILRRIRSIAWENEPNLNILGLSMDSVGQFERIKVINMQMHAYL